jgi:hypothetical protein
MLCHPQALEGLAVLLNNARKKVAELLGIVDLRNLFLAHPSIGRALRYSVAALSDP